MAWKLGAFASAVICGALILMFPALIQFPNYLATLAGFFVLAGGLAALFRWIGDQ